MANRRKYEDAAIAASMFTQGYYNALLDNPRSFEPRTEWHSPLVAMASGTSGGAFVVDTRAGEDGFWRPTRDKRLGDRMITYIPPEHHPLCGVRSSACGCTP